jgi:hypothetical protein
MADILRQAADFLQYPFSRRIAAFEGYTFKAVIRRGLAG